MKHLPRRKQIGFLILLTVLYAAACGCIFPAINFNRERSPLPLITVLLNLVVLVMMAKAAGTLIPALLPRWSLPKIGLYSFAASAAGLAARFLLELGEVSNKQNFTVGNVIFHLAAAVGLTLLAARKTIKERIRPDDGEE